MARPTKAILLAAGYGTRLQPLTETLPKALVPLVGIPLVRHCISRLAHDGISSIGINTHHHADHMNQFASEQRDYRIHISHEPSILGSAGGIGGFREFLDGEDCFIVCNADSVSNISCDQVLSDFTHHSPLVTMVLTDNPATNNVCINAHQEVIDLRDSLHPPDISDRLTYTGIACMSRDFLKSIPPGASELVPLLLGLICKNPGCVRAVIAHNAAWRDIGTIDSYLQAHREILLERRPLVDENCIPPDALYIGKNTYIDADCTCTGFLSIGSNSHIGPGCSLHDCVIWDTTTLPAGSILRNAVCGPGFVINGR
jgi:NDP-sugar pyrophosphorylase family protein